MDNPTVLAAGILGTRFSILKRVEEMGAGAVTTKSIGPKAKEGHNNPTVFSYGPGLMNAVGLSTLGYKNMEEEWDNFKRIDVPLIASIYASTVEDFIVVAENVAQHKPNLIEINISCPNVESETFGKHPDLTRQVVAGIKEVANGVPIMPKLTPSSEQVVKIAQVCQDAGADAISAFNTWGPGMYIVPRVAKPFLDFDIGGVSGPAIRPLVVKKIYDLYQEIDLPILALGGIKNGRDAAEMIEAGATAVGIGSAVYDRDIEVYFQVANELKEIMEDIGVNSIGELRGLAHE